MDDRGNTAGEVGADAASPLGPYAGDIALTPDGLHYLGLIRRAPRSVLPVLGCNSFDGVDHGRHAI